MGCPLGRACLILTMFVFLSTNDQPAERTFSRSRVQEGCEGNEAAKETVKNVCFANERFTATDYSGESSF